MWFISDNAGPRAPGGRSRRSPAPTSGYARLLRRRRGHGAGDGRSSREVFEAPEAAVYLVATGTAANALALACLCPPWGTVYCHRDAHVSEDECGAPEFYTGGAKLTPLDGRARPHRPGRARRGIGDRARAQRPQRAARRAVADQRHRGRHRLRPRRSGGARRPSPARIGLPVHMDGARFANALARARLHARPS